MAGISRVVATVVCVWCIAAGGGWSSEITVAAAPPLPDCKIALIQLQDCLKFVTGITSSPNAACCSGVLDIHQTDPACLCVLALNDTTTELIPNYRLDLAGQMPTLCSVQGASVSNCPALLGETNTTTTSGGPVSSAPSNGDAGGAYGGAYRLKTSTNLRAFMFTYLGIVLAASALLSKL